MNGAADTVTLIILTLNEVDGMRAIMPTIDPAWYDELLVIDGGSTDGTVEYCAEMGYPLLRQTGRSLPNAMCEAFAASSGGIVISFSPDGNSLAGLIPQLTAKIREGFDMVIASRYAPGAASYDDSRTTRFGNWFFTAATNLLFGASYSDTLVMLRAYRREAVEAMRLPGIEHEHALHQLYPLMSCWEPVSCIRAAQLGLRVCEIPGDEPPRLGGERKLSIIRNGAGVVLSIANEFLIGPTRRRGRGKRGLLRRLFQ